MEPKKARKVPGISDACLFDLIILAFFVTLSVVSFAYNPRARSIPLGVGIAGAVMIFLQLLADGLPKAKARLRFVAQQGLLESPSSARPQALSGTTGTAAGSEVAVGSEQAVPAAPPEGVTKEPSWGTAFRAILWLVGFVVLLGLFNYLVAVGVFVLLITRLEARESWVRSIGLALGTTLAFFILFEVILHARLQ